MPIAQTPKIKARITIAGKPQEFSLGKGLISFQLAVGEKERSNNCAIVVADPNLQLAAVLRNIAIKAGGIAVPKSLFPEDDSVTGAAGVVPASSKTLPKDGRPGSDATAYIGGTVEISLSAEYRAYLDMIAWCEGAAYNTTYAYGAVITDFSRHPSIVQGSGIRSDASGRYQFLSTTWAGLNISTFSPQNQDLGAKKLIEGRGAAGHVARGLAGLDRFMDSCSYEWASIPASDGGFRYPGQGSKTPAMLRDFLGQALSYYKSGGITGQSRSTPQSISGKAPDLTPSVAGATAAAAAGLIKDAGIKSGLQVNPVQNETTATGIAATIADDLLKKAGIKSTGQTIAPGKAVDVAALTGIPDGAIELSIEISDGKIAQRFQFWYTGHETSTDLPPRTTINGQGIRFVMAQNSRSRRVYENMSLRQIAERIGNKYGVTVEVPSTPATEKIAQVISQAGVTDYQFLSQIAAASGYIIKESPGTAGNIGSMQLVAAGKLADVYKVMRAWGAKYSTEESADDDRKLEKLPAISSIADGKAIGEGFNSTLSMNFPSMELVGIQPGSIVDVLLGEVANLPKQTAFCREYRVKSSTIAFSKGNYTQSLALYIPVAIEGKQAAKGSAGSPIGAQAAPPANIAIPADVKRYFLVRPKGSKTEFGENLLTLEAFRDGVLLGAVDCVSGSGNVQDLSLANISGSYAPCPPGRFRLGPAEIIPTTSAMGNKYIDVLDTPGRAGIAIHTDYNRSYSPGTAGCIGILLDSDMQSVMEWRGLGLDVMIVNYAGWIP